MSRINIRPSDCKFVVNREKNKVVCILEDTKYYAHQLIWNMPIYKLLNSITSELKMPDHFIGIATCSSNDEWDEALGRRLAFLRMREKFYMSLFKHVDNYIKKLDESLASTVDEINAFGDKVEYNINKEREWLKEHIHE